jgi:BirA family biotin operon repressor/biotin-[acetyl-CoA-carboxylase] ligase
MAMTSVDISPLDVKKLAYLLVDGYWQVSVFKEIDSTQTFLTSKVPHHGEVVAAEYQSAGRGRLERKFEAAQSRSLLFSFYFEPKRKRDEWGWIPLIAGLAVERVLNRQKKIFVTKWPNDVLVKKSSHNGKVSGILSEASHNGVVVGIGLNVSMNQDELPVPTASSLFLVDVVEQDRNFYLAEILTEFAELMERWEAHEDLRSLYEENCATIGADVEIHGTSGAVERGRVEKIGNLGELILEGNRHIYSGDVIHLYT